MTASTLTYPLDLIRTIISVRVNEAPSIFKVGKEIFSSSGIFGFYKGWLASLLGITPYIAIKMSVFEYLKIHFLPDRNYKWFHIVNLALGGIAG